MQAATDTHDDAAPSRPGEQLLRGWVHLWTWGGAFLPVVLLVAVPPTLGELSFAGLILLLCLVGSLLTVEFADLGDTAEYTPASIGWIAAIVYLPPALAVAVVVLTELTIAWIREREGLSVFSVANFANAVAIVGICAHAWIPLPPSPQTTIVVGLLVTLAFEALHLATGAAGVVAKGLGGMDVIRDEPAPTVFAILLAPVALAVAAPFVGNPYTTIAILFACTVGTWVLLAALSREQHQRVEAVRVRSTLSRYLSPMVVDKLTGAGVDVGASGEQREISVLFCDIRGFTTFAEQHAPTDVIDRLNEMLVELVEVVFEHEGVLDKYTGDGFMAFWGAPLEQPDHAARAAAAAREIVQMARRNRPSTGLDIGVGIHTGPAIVGNIGHPSRVDYTAIGDTVNLAARLEAATKELGAPAVASQSVVDELPEQERDSWLAAGSIRVKGRTEPTQVHVYAP